MLKLGNSVKTGVITLSFQKPFQSFTNSRKILCARYGARDTRVEAWTQLLPSTGFQCQVGGRPGNQGLLTQGTPEELQAKPNLGEEVRGERGVRSVQRQRDVRRCTGKTAAPWSRN